MAAKGSGNRRLLQLDETPLLAGLVPQHFGVILADPPWYFKNYTALQVDNPGSRRDVDRHYATMSVDQIKELPIAELANPSGCHLFLWTTGPCLPQAFDVIKAWGFKYSSVAFTWAKLKKSYDASQLRMSPTAAGDFHVGLGLTTRKNAEFCLLARRGNARRIAKDVRELIIAPRREHSRKPDETYERIERYAAGPYLELFGRQQRPNWTVRGDEAHKFTGGNDGSD
jgi:N6-adenosine-specific RNA methylase IME4